MYEIIAEAAFDLAVKYGPDIIKAIKDAITDAVKSIPKAAGKALQELSYQQAMTYFRDHQNDSPRIAKGVLLRLKKADGYTIIQTFLDQQNALVSGENGIPLGQQISVKGLDETLQNAFKIYDLVIVQ